MAEGKGSKLGDLYFDVLLKDGTAPSIEKIKQKLDSLKITLKPKVLISENIELDSRHRFIINKATLSSKAKQNIQNSLDNNKWKLNDVEVSSTAAKKLETAFTSALKEAVEKGIRAGAKSVRATAGTSGGGVGTGGTGGTGGGGKTSGSVEKEFQLYGSKMNFIGGAFRMFGFYEITKILRDAVLTAGEFEMQLTSLQSIIGSKPKGKTLFDEIKDFSVISPFQFKQLASFAKQLAAFQIPTNDIFDTTKRLADLSAGLGVSMDRLILAYGQVSTATVLKGQELRQFSEAGVPMLQKLADFYTQKEGELVTAAEVFERVSKRLVSFQDVKSVIEIMTSEGGEFFDMQEKQASTLKGKISNLADAYDLMIYKMGSSDNTFFKGLIDSLTWLMSHSNVVGGLLFALGGFTVSRSIFGGDFSKNVKVIKKINANLTTTAATLTLAKTRVQLLGLALKEAFMANAIFMIIGAIAELCYMIYDYYQDVQELKKAWREMCEDMVKTWNSLDKDLSNIEKKIEVDLDSNANTKQINDYVDKVAKEFEDQFSGLGAFLTPLYNGTQSDRYQAAKQLKEEMLELSNVLENNEIPIPNGGVAWGLLSDGLIDDLEDYSKLLNDFKKIDQGFRVLNRRSEYREVEAEIHDYMTSLGPQINKLATDMQKVAYISKVFDTLNGDISTAVRDFAKIKTEVNFIGKSFTADRYFFNEMKEVAKDLGIDVETLFRKMADGSTVVSGAYDSALNRLQGMLGMGKDAWNELVKYVKENPLQFYVTQAGEQKLGSIQRVVANKIVDAMRGSGTWDEFSREKGTNGETEIWNNVKDALTYTRGALEKNGSVSDLAKELKSLRDDAEKILKDTKALGSGGGNQANIDKAQANLDEVKKVINILGFTYDEDNKKANKSEDEFVKQLKAKYERFKKAIEWFEKYAKIMPKAEARMKVLSDYSDLFQGDKNAAKYFEVGGIQLLAQLFMGKIKGRTTSQAEALRTTLRGDMEKGEFQKDEHDFKESNEVIKDIIEAAAKRFRLYRELLKITGNTDLALRVSGIKHEPRQTELEDRIATFNELADKNSLPRFEDAKSLEQAKELFGVDSEMLKEWSDISKLQKSEFETVANNLKDIINGYRTVSEEIAALEQKREDAKDAIDRAVKAGQLDLVSGIALKNRVDAKTDLETFKKQAGYLTLMNAPLAFLAKEADKVAAEAREKLRNAYVAEAISPQQYADELKKLDEQLYKIGDKRSGLMSALLDTKESKKQRRLQEAEDKRTRLVAEKAPQAEIDKQGEVISGIKAEIKADKDRAEAISKVASAASGLADGLASLFESVGDEATADALRVVGSVAQGVEKIANSKNGVEMAINVATTAISFMAQIFQLHDKNLQRMIDDSKRRVKDLENEFAKAEKRIERTLGGALTIDKGLGSLGATYSKQYQNMIKQLTEVEEQLSLERQKKKQDKDAILDYQKQIAELKDSVKYFVLDLAKTLYDIDIKSWAQTIGDALVEAFAKGESAAEAFNGSVGDMLKNVLKKIISLELIEPAMRDIQAYIEAQMGSDDDSPFRLDTTELAGLTPLLASLRGVIGEGEKMWDEVDKWARANGIDMSGTSSGLSADIKGITEETADLLASYINAMRADLSMIRVVNEQGWQDMSVIAEQQITQMRTIAQNTLRNAEAAERIENAINSVITTGAGGKKIRI